MKRRDIFGVAAALAAGLVAVLPSAYAASREGVGVPGDRVAVLADRLLQPYTNRSSLITIGHAVRQDGVVGEGVGPNGVADAIDNLLNHLNVSEAELWRLSSAAIRHRIREETARDFTGDRILPVRGVAAQRNRDQALCRRILCRDGTGLRPG